MKNYLVTERLRNGTEVIIRAIRPEDKGLLLAAYKELEQETVYMRFFTLKKDLTEEELKFATEIDFIRHVALVACIRECGQERIIAAASYIVGGEPARSSSAEIEFTVEEDYQGLGLASILLRHLVSIGRKRGLSSFEADVLPSNTAMLRVFSRAGLPMTTVSSGSSVHVTLFLNEGAGEEKKQES